MDDVKKGQATGNTFHRSFSYIYSDIFAFLLIALAAFIVYSNSFDCQFHFDDESSITGNPQIKKLSSFYDIDYWITSYRPLAFFSFALNYHFTGPGVFGYHLVNLLIHIISGIFVFLLIKLVLDLNNYKNYKIDKHKYWFALLGALIFVVHPIQTQAITYIVQRMASMAAMFYIMSVYFYSWGRIEQVRNNKVFKSILLYVLALTAGIFGVMTKQNTITFPIAFLLFEFCFIRSKENKIYKSYIIVSLSAIFVVFISFLVFHSDIFTSALHGTNISGLNYFFNQFIVIAKYLQLTILPINQCADYGNVEDGFPLVAAFWRYDVIGCFLLLIGLFTLAVYLFKRNKASSFGILWFFLTLSIESSIIPIADPMFEHRMYLPMVGIIIFLLSSLFMTASKLKTTYLYSFIVLLVFIFGILSHSRNNVWKNDLTLWTDVIENAPNNARAWFNRGVALAFAGRHEEAIISHNKAIEIKPEYCEAWYNKGVALALTGKEEEAVKCYDKALEIRPEYCDARYNKGVILAQAGKYDEAIACYDKVIKIRQEYYKAWNNKGTILASLGRQEEAVKCFDKVIKIKPEFFEAWYNKGTAIVLLAKYQEAVNCFDKAIEIKPNYFEAWYNKGTTIALTENSEEAVICFDKVIEIKPDMYEAWNSKGNIFGKSGRFEEAIQCYNKALEIHPGFKAAQNNKLLAQQKIEQKNRRL